MSTPTPPSFNVLDAAKEISAGNADAESFIVVYWAFVHTLDDLVDRDKTPSAEDVATATLSLIETIAFNPFVRENSGAIISSIRTAALVWVDSERLSKQESVKDKVVGNILKSAYQETIFLVASIVGGFRHAMAMQAKYRGYDFD